MAICPGREPGDHRLVCGMGLGWRQTLTLRFSRMFLTTRRGGYPTSCLNWARTRSGVQSPDLSPTFPDTFFYGIISYGLIEMFVTHF